MILGCKDMALLAKKTQTNKQTKKKLPYLGLATKCILIPLSFHFSLKEELAKLLSLVFSFLKLKNKIVLEHMAPSRKLLLLLLLLLLWAEIPPLLGHWCSAWLLTKTSSSGHRCGSCSVPGLGTSTCCGCSQKKKKDGKDGKKATSF